MPPYWGFSVWDFGAGTIGAIVPYAERFWGAMKYIDFKMSYYKRSNHYWDLGLLKNLMLLHTHTLIRMIM